MRILVTGDQGFIGTWLSRELRQRGHIVDGIDHHADGCIGGPNDLRVPGVAHNAIRDRNPDVVVHLAAKVGRLFGEENPADTIDDNAGMTALVAQACGTFGARLIYASTSEVYGDNGAEVCDEVYGPFVLPHNVYGLSKRWGEEVAELYAPDELTILRFSMPYGPGLPAGRGRAAIINMLWQARTHQTITVHRGSERSWCWIGDTVRAARIAIEETDGGAFNIGRDDNPVPMSMVAQMACVIANTDGQDLIEYVDAPEAQTVVKRLSTDAIRRLGWEPLVDLEDGMERTMYEWVELLNEDGSASARALATLR